MVTPRRAAFACLLLGTAIATRAEPARASPTEPAERAGFSVDVEYASSYGPDAWGSLRAKALAGPGLEVGVLGLGGTRPAWMATAARTLVLADGVRFRGELALGMVRSLPRAASEAPGDGTDRGGGPGGGFEAEVEVDAGSLTAVVDYGWLTRVGHRASGGVDVPLPGGFGLGPRVQFDTWAGDRDPGVRAILGLQRGFANGWWVRVSGSAGGRDVLHLGPGFSLCFGRLPR